jgi:hypothetical protein
MNGESKRGKGRPDKTGSLLDLFALAFQDLEASSLEQLLKHVETRIFSPKDYLLMTRKFKQADLFVLGTMHQLLRDLVRPSNFQEVMVGELSKLRVRLHEQQED